MAEKRTFISRVRAKISKRTSSPQAVVATDSSSASRPYLRPSTQNLDPSTPNLPTTPNLPATSILPTDPNLLTILNPLPPAGQRDEFIVEATSSVSPGTVNVVGHDQFNVTTHIHINPTGKRQITANISTSSICPFRAFHPTRVGCRA
jgi:hypothetical protein